MSERCGWLQTHCSPKRKFQQTSLLLLASIDDTGQRYKRSKRCQAMSIRTQQTHQVAPQSAETWQKSDRKLGTLQRSKQYYWEVANRNWQMPTRAQSRAQLSAERVRQGRTYADTAQIKTRLRLPDAQWVRSSRHGRSLVVLGHYLPLQAELWTTPKQSVPKSSWVSRWWLPLSMMSSMSRWQTLLPFSVLWVDP